MPAQEIDHAVNAMVAFVPGDPMPRTGHVMDLGLGHHRQHFSHARIIDGVHATAALYVALDAEELAAPQSPCRPCPIVGFA